MKVLCLCDSPTLTSGFASVARNLFARWHAAGVEVEVWGIGFGGWGYKQYPYAIYPGGGGEEWATPRRLSLFLRQLEIGGYSHVWIMQDTFALSEGDFPKRLRQVCLEKNIRSMLYFPVDAPIDAAWAKIIEAVDLAVAYTHYGKAEAQKHVKVPILTLPHGVDAELFQPVQGRAELRAKLWKAVRDGQVMENAWCGPDDFLMVNVSQHQRRKDVTRCFDILAGLRACGVPAKMLFHMEETSSVDYTSLSAVARQHGFTEAVEWGHHGPYFRNGQSTIKEANLRWYYSVADLFLTTTLGEGWGLPITEALACGCPVAMPNHTACAEIASELRERGMGGRAVLMPVETAGVVNPMDNSRVRYRVDVGRAVDAIEKYYHDGHWKHRQPLNAKMREFLSWDRIAATMLDWLKCSPEVLEVLPSCTRQSDAVLPRRHDYYLEFGGGLGDVFSQIFHRGAYTFLENLPDRVRVKVALFCHNPAAAELFLHNHHISRRIESGQIEFINVGYLHTAEEQAAGRAKFGLPPAGEQDNGIIPESKEPIFKMTEGDLERFFNVQPSCTRLAGSDCRVQLQTSNLKPQTFIVFSVSAGLSERTFSATLFTETVWRVVDAGYPAVIVGRNYDRHGRTELRETDLSFDLCKSEKVIDLVDQLSVPGTAALVQASAGLVTCHSALNLLAWHLRKPQLLLYPPFVFERHFKNKDQWAFGADFPETVHGLFEDYQPEWMEKFLKCCRVAPGSQTLPAE